MLEYEIVSKSNYPEVFFENVVLKNFEKIHRKKTTQESIFK